MSYEELKNQIQQAQRDLHNALRADEINYYGTQLMILEDKMATMIAKGRR